MAGYLVSLATFSAIYGLLALGLNLMWGLAGMANLAVLAYFAIGAYASAILTLSFGVPIGIAMVLAGVVGCAAGAASCVGIVRLRGDYLAIVTLGMSEVLRLVAENEDWLTGGTHGLAQIPRPLRNAFDGWYGTAYLLFSLLVLAACLIVLERLRTAPFGRVLRAIREDDDVTATAGKNVFLFQAKTLAIGGAAMGLAGAIYAHYLTFISPDIFQPDVLLYIFFALIVGGKGNNYGAILGSFAVVFLLESTRFLTAVVPAISGVQAGALRGILIGGGLLLVLIFRPSGVLPERRPVYPKTTSPGGEPEAEPTRASKEKEDALKGIQSGQAL